MQPTTQKRGVVVFCHGYGVHAVFDILKPLIPGGPHVVYENSFTQRLVDAGYALWTFDCQGHGVSGAVENLKAYFNRFTHLADDFLLFTRLVREHEQGSSVPFFACGPSMGGGVIARAARLQPNFVDGMILVAPMLCLDNLANGFLNRLVLPVGEWMSDKCPTWRIARMERTDRFPDSHNEFIRDPLNDSSQYCRARPAWEFYQFALDMMKHCDEISTPFVTIHSETDTLVDPNSSRILYRDAKVRDKSYIQFNHMWHSLLNEDGCEEVFEAIVKWLHERTDKK
jgi:acylglycerol lipase